MKKKLIKFLSLIGLFTLSSCGNVSNNLASPIRIYNALGENSIETRKTYTNKFDDDKIPNQWSEYGVGDPFVYRYNGRYYLYCSTKNFETGVRGWVSDDLINWEMMTGEGLENGYVSNDPCTVTAYAPEVIYYDGYFYMIQSQGGNGHYLLKADKPEGPFVKVKDNFGESIDGSFFLDDDEQLYFLRASNTGIRLVKFNDDLTLGSSKTLDNTQLGGWTEGPYLLKRDGIYYLTYTGNNVVSDGYRVAYSYATDTLFDRSAFTEGDTILLNTSSDFKGLGHSSTVLGPDLDSYYIAYHNLNSSGGPDRSFNLSRLSFSGTKMSVDYASLNDNYVPASPEFSVSDESGLEKEGNFYLTNSQTEGNAFSAEYNFIGAETECVFSYIDSNNYSYVSLKDKKVSLYEVTSGKENFISEEKLIKDYDFSKLHTVRLSYKNGKLSVFFDNMNKINCSEKEFNNGKIGYKKAGGTTIFHTSYSLVGQGSSDSKEVFQDQVLATNYYYSKFTNSKIVEEEADADDQYGDRFNGKLKSKDVKFASKNDYAIYRINVQEDGRYGLDFVLTKDSAGKKVLIQIDEETPIRMTIPSNNDDLSKYYKANIGEIELSKGYHFLTVIAEDEIQYNSFQLFKSSATWPKFEDSLSTYVSKGAKYINSWKISENGHYALSGNRNLMYFGDGSFTDFTMEVDIELIGETQANSCGIILRADNPAFGSSDNASSIQGYYCGFNNSKLFISRCDYNHSNMDASADALKISSNESHHLKAVIRGNKITLTLDDDRTIEYVDPLGFTHGNIGLYTDGAASIYRNIKIYH